MVFKQEYLQLSTNLFSMAKYAYYYSSIINCYGFINQCIGKLRNLYGLRIEMTHFIKIFKFCFSIQKVDSYLHIISLYDKT